jgi:hypothetical protein
VNALATQNEQLSDELAAVQLAKTELEAQLAETPDDLAAIRASLRRMIRAENTAEQHKDQK